jgi:hypothetical protein
MSLSITLSHGTTPAHEAGAHDHEVVRFGSWCSEVAQSQQQSDLAPIREK